MKKLLSVFLIIAVLALAGCTSNNGNPGATNGTNASILQNQDGSNSSIQKSEASSDIKPVEPGAVPQLSAGEKNQVNTEVNSALNKIDGALKSLQDPQDIDLSSVN